MIKKNILPDQLYIEKIRHKLWNDGDSSKVSVMIGAGFSLNADKISENASSFLLWSELISKMKSDLYPYEKNNVNTATSEALKIASEYELVFGRQALDELLIKSLPDNNYVPGELHKELMSLPWSDVYTTNYDTLLERATNYVYDRKYSLVVSPEDIASSSKPRIVKLHGSFPSNRPFIITEEDYRVYPNKFSSFINMVRQSIMENILCLIGFSGDDPNFLKWIGWVKDSIGKNSNQIYFIGFVNQSQRRILEVRGIIPIDLSPLFPEEEYYGNNRYKMSLEWFFMNLKYGKQSNIKEWPKLEVKNNKKIKDKEYLPLVPVIEYKDSYVNEKIRHYNYINSLNKKEILDVIKEWEKIRKSYPGWIICPRDKRINISSNTNSYILNKINILELHEQLRLVYEVNWRYEVSLTTLDESIAESIRGMIDAINPFDNTIKVDNGTINFKKYENNLRENREYKEFHLNYSEVKKKWIDLSLSLLRFYREEFKLDLFEKLKSNLEGSISQDTEYYSKLLYEEIMFNLSIRNENEIRSKLNKWVGLKDSPELKLKRAGILAEIGDIKEAENLAKNVLNEIRSNIVPGEVNIFELSKEGWAMLLVKAIDQNDISLMFDKEYSKEYIERWNILSKYDCNPWSELEWIRDVLEMSTPEHKYSNIIKGFDRNSITRIIRSESPYKKQINISYSFLRMLENIGIPHELGNVSMFKKASINAAKWISKYSLSWALSTIIRCNEKDGLNFIMSKEKLYIMSDSSVNDYLNIFLKSLDNAIDNEPMKGTNYRFYYIQIEYLSEIISRLTIRLNDNQIEETYNISLKLYKSVRVQRDIHLKESIKILFKRLLDSMTDVEKISKLKELLEIDLELENKYKLNSQNYQVYVFDYLNFKEYNCINEEEIHNQLKKQIDENLNLLKSNDINISDRSLTRLYTLYRLNILNEEEIQQFGNIIWNKEKDENGFPRSNKYLESIYIDIPRPKEIDISNLFLEYLEKNDIRRIYSFEYGEDGEGKINHSFYKGLERYIYNCKSYINNIYINKKNNCINLDNKHTKILLEKVELCLDDQKGGFMINNEKSFYKNFSDHKEYIGDIINLLALSVIPNISVEDFESINILKSILNKINSMGYNTLYTLPPLLRLKLIEESELMNRINIYLIRDEEESNILSINTIYYWLCINKDSKDIIKNIELVELLINSMYYRSGNVLNNIIKIIINIVEQELVILDELFIKKIITYLYSVNLNDRDIIDRQSIDKYYYCCNLAKGIYNLLNSDNKEIPEIINRWKDFSENNVLREIRNIWI